MPGSSLYGNPADAGIKDAFLIDVEIRSVAGSARSEKKTTRYEGIDESE